VISLDLLAILGLRLRSSTSSHRFRVLFERTVHAIDCSPDVDNVKSKIPL